MDQKVILLEQVYTRCDFLSCGANPIQNFINRKGIPSNFYENRDKIKTCEEILDITANMTIPCFIFSEVLDISFRFSFKLKCKKNGSSMKPLAIHRSYESFY